MEPFQYQVMSDIPYFSLSCWEEKFPDLVVGFSARRLDESMDERNYALHVGKNLRRVVQQRRSLAKQIGIDFAAWTCGEQVHGVHIRQVESCDRGRGYVKQETAFPHTDGLLTKETDILLTSYYADCVPLYFYSSDIDMIGVAHAGWKGTVGQIGVKMVEALQSEGADVKQIRAAIGPSIGVCCYEVDEPVIKQVQEALLDERIIEKVVVNHLPGKWQLNLKETNAELLKRAGVKAEHIALSKWCTSCDQAYFYSHRRDRGKTGRMVAWIGKRKRESNGQNSL
jgi:polyphenol oxidase